MPLASSVVYADSVLRAAESIRGFDRPASQRVVPLRYDTAGVSTRLVTLASTFEGGAPAVIRSYLRTTSGRFANLRIGGFGGTDPEVVVGRARG